ncbi:head-tail connector protein [Ancylobacter oerskovii]|uniref:Uncharacterized protein n=1 Tax=Ancylobacter oerskovii TaxID=459519 RepID=A0ABW4Z123_9HYPH|nr:hypothetical protein [Ancylobacter oerskovii]MBS7545113.1 hypothetical protein [Ancylobacter oerskovii]
MWYPSKVIAPPAAEPISLALAKQQCGIPVNETGRDAELTAAIAGARGLVEKVCGIRLVTQTVDMVCDGFCDLRALPDAPLQSVTSITYLDTEGAPQTVPTAVYEGRLDGLEPSIVLAHGKQWPTTRRGSRITIKAVAGYGLAADVPPDLVSAMLLKIGSAMSMSGKDMLVRSVEVHDVATRQYGGIVDVTASMDRAFLALLANYQRGLLA